MCRAEGFFKVGRRYHDVYSCGAIFVQLGCGQPRSAYACYHSDYFLSTSARACNDSSLSESHVCH